jgi:hypothetical protein
MFVKCADKLFIAVTFSFSQHLIDINLINNLRNNIMKTLKSIILGLSLVILCSAAKATENPTEEKSTRTYAITAYIDAMTSGKTSGLSDVLDQSAQFSMLRGKKVMTYDKQAMLRFLEANGGVKQDCTTNTTVVENNTDLAVVKVDMKYGEFTRSNYVTLLNTGSGWKITNVYSVFK